MSDLKIAVILGSTRPGRLGKAVADWVVQQAAGRAGADYELIDLADYPLPHLDEPVPPSLGRYVDEHTKAWAAKIASSDGFVSVRPEYNHSTSGVLKDAIDYLYAEWNNKATAFVGYGSLGETRAIEHLRAVPGELKIATIRQQLSFSLGQPDRDVCLIFHDFENFSDFKPMAIHAKSAKVLFDQLESRTSAMKSIRS